jgi:hypothetical protein
MQAIENLQDRLGIIALSTQSQKPFRDSGCRDWVASTSIISVLSIITIIVKGCCASLPLCTSEIIQALLFSFPNSKSPILDDTRSTILHIS